MRPTPDRFKGLAATRWILDASTILRNDLAPYARWSSGGSVLTSDLNVPGGQFTLGGGQADSYAALFSPFKFGNSAGSLRAWSVEVETMGCQGSRGVVEVGAFSSTYDDLRTSIRWDDTGMLLIPGNIQDSTIKLGNFKQTAGVNAGTLVEVPDGTASAVATGWVGGVEVKSGRGAFASGMLDCGITHSGVGEISLRSLVVTAYWSVAGDMITKVI